MNKRKGNKGEWSEVYAFLRILADGRIYGADSDANKREDVFYDVLKVLRDEDKNTLEYILSEDGKHVSVVKNGFEVLSIERSRLSDESDRLLNTIKTSKGSFRAEDTLQFLSEIERFNIKSPSGKKQDIVIQIHDARTGMEPQLGFSIKSMLGSSSTLLNASQATNFIFEVYDKNNGRGSEPIIPPGSSKHLKEWCAKMEKSGMEFRFEETASRTFGENLSLIDVKLPEIVAEMLKLHYIEGVSGISEQVKTLHEKDPLNIETHNGISAYEYKIKKLLAAVALGMRPATPWNGIEDASGGYIIVKKNGEVLCYHIYNRNDFEEYLFTHTKLETSSTTKHNYAEFSVEDSKNTVKLNLQIRFK